MAVVHQLDSDSNDSLEEDDVENETVQNRVKVRRDMTAKDLDISDLLNARMFKNKKILETEKMMLTMQDAISFTEDDADLVIDSRG